MTAGRSCGSVGQNSTFGTSKMPDVAQWLRLLLICYIRIGRRFRMNKIEILLTYCRDTEWPELAQ